MRLADQSRLFGDLQCRPHDKAQRIFDQKVVIQAGEIVSVLRHLANPLVTFCFGRGTAKESGTLLLPGAFQTPPARAQADWTLRSVTPAAVRLRLRPEQCCRLQLLHGPITAGTIPSENTAFTTCVDPVSPPVFQPLCCIRCLASACRCRLKWWRRRVPPPGPLCLFHSTFIAIAGKPAPSI